jgi:hypothetical protein
VLTHTKFAAHVGSNTHRANLSGHLLMRQVPTEAAGMGSMADVDIGLLNSMALNKKPATVRLPIEIMS